MKIPLSKKTSTSNSTVLNQQLGLINTNENSTIQRRLSALLKNQQDGIQNPIQKKNKLITTSINSSKGAIQRMKITPTSLQQKYPLFFKESFAGLLGYSSHYFKAPVIPNKTLDAMTPNRKFFHNELMKLYDKGHVPRWAHQLMWQNAMQEKYGGDLPINAANHMLKYLQLMGKEAQDGGNRMLLAKHYYNFQIGSIYHFENGGSSKAPWLLHRMGLALQMPYVFTGGKYWVNRPAQGAVLTNPLVFIALAAAFSLFFGYENWKEKEVIKPQEEL